jgi:hypothetical protein
VNISHFNNFFIGSIIIQLSQQHQVGFFVLFIILSNGFIMITSINNKLKNKLHIMIIIKHN